MPQVVAYETAKAAQRQRPHDIRVPFLTNSAESPHLPAAFLSQGTVGKVIGPHWHAIDQFQIITAGRGKLGRKEISPYTVQFVRAYTPYGPLVDDGKAAVTLLTLRSCFDPPLPGTTSGAHFLPAYLDKLKQVPDRRPWQVTRQVTFSSQPQNALPGTVDLIELPDIKDDQGLFACTLSMAPNTQTVAPDPSSGDGQFLLIVTGSLWYANREHKALAIVFVSPAESPFQLAAGTHGLEAIIMNFPKPQQGRSTVRAAGAGAAGLRKWQCELCAFAYDEAAGIPGDGIPPGTRWEDVPVSWTCPDCSAAKHDFRMIEV